MVEGFAWALAGFGIDEIREAMRKYILSNSDVPAPNDILNIIKEMRFYAKIQAPDIETLRRYKEKGIALTEAQKKMLGDA